MYYYLIGVLLLLIARLLVNLQYTERKINTTMFHETGTVMFGLYLILIFRYLSEHILAKNNEPVIAVLLLVPCGFLLPMLYARYRHFSIALVNGLFLSGCICLFQWIHLGKTAPVSIIFYMAGIVLGNLIYHLNAGIFETVRRSFLIRKKKHTRLSTFVIFEADFIIFLIVMMFVISGVTYRVIDQKEGTPDQLKEMKQDPQDNPYSDIYYAKQENYSRYNAYAAGHPELSVEDVVWRVEAKLDKAFYSDMYEYPQTEKDPLLVNKYNRVPDSFEPQNLVKVYGEFYATADTKAAYEQMKRDAKAAGYDLHIVSAYRSVSYQAGLYKTFKNRDGQEAADTYSARAGCSEHCTGRALDISNNSSDLDVFDGTEEWKWCVENAHKYGFILRYPKGCEDITGFMYESWQFTYVGTEIADKMRKENIATLEEYVVKYIDNQN